MPSPDRPSFLRQSLLHTNMHAFHQALKRLDIPPEQLLRVTIDPELDLSIDTPRGTLHTVSAFAMAAEIVSLDSGETTDVRVVGTPQAYRDLQASRTAPDPGTLSFTLSEYRALLEEITRYRRRLRRYLLTLVSGLMVAALLLAALLALVFLEAPPLVAVTAAAVTGAALWALAAYWTRMGQGFVALDRLPLRGVAWVPDTDEGRRLYALMMERPVESTTP